MDSIDDSYVEGVACNTLKVSVVGMAGDSICDVSPIPESVAHLKAGIAERTGVSARCQQLLKDGGASICEDEEALPDLEDLVIVMMVDETPMIAWDYEGNPQREQLTVDGSDLQCPKLCSDVNWVVTQEPVRHGVHYFQFVMHTIGDEQSCGLVADKSVAGDRFLTRGVKGYLYYCGRMGTNHGDLHDGKGALHAEGRAVQEFDKLRREGDVIGMLVDRDVNAVAFDLNGRLQGACAIPAEVPLYLITQLDRAGDHVELRKLSLTDSPPDNLEAFQSALADISKGVEHRRRFCDVQIS